MSVLTCAERGRLGGRASSKLTLVEVVAIHERLQAGEEVGVIAAEYGVHQSTVSRIRSGERWAHVRWGGVVGSVHDASSHQTKPKGARERGE